MDDFCALHIYAQGGPHDDAVIVGTKEALEKLYDTIGRVLVGKRNDSCMGVFTSDGEGYDVSVKMLSAGEMDGQPTPYTDKIFRNENKEGTDYDEI